MAVKCWTDEQDDILTSMWGSASAAQIGRRLGKTRNSVISRAHRLNLKKLKNPSVSSIIHLKNNLQVERDVEKRKQIRDAIMREMCKIKKTEAKSIQSVKKNDPGVKGQSYKNQFKFSRLYDNPTACLIKQCSNLAIPNYRYCYSCGEKAAYLKCAKSKAA